MSNTAIGASDCTQPRFTAVVARPAIRLPPTTRGLARSSSGPARALTTPSFAVAIAQPPLCPSDAGIARKARRANGIAEHQKLYHQIPTARLGLSRAAAASDRLPSRRGSRGVAPLCGRGTRSGRGRGGLLGGCGSLDLTAVRLVVDV